MMKKVYLTCYLLLLAGTVSLAQQRPNIVFIISDDHAYQTIGAYGSQYAATPNIDRIARGGALFSKAYVNNSICGPSRASILTGKYSHVNGFKDNENSTFDFNQDNFAKHLQASGYQTAWIGKMHLGDSTPQGFNYYNILPAQGQYYNPDFIGNGNILKHYTGYVSNIITQVAEQWLDGRDTTKPFCLVVGHKATHRTWMPDLGDLDLYENTRFPIPHDFYDHYATRKAAAAQDMTIAHTLQPGYDLKMFDSEADAEKDGNIKRMTPEQRTVFLSHYEKIYADLKARHLDGDSLTVWKFQRYMRDYMATAASLDRNIGRLLDYLDAHNLSENTIVIYMSDQGFYMGEHGWFDKRFMYEESFRTPMVMRYPGVIKPGTRIGDMVMNIDLAPTLLDAAGAVVPGDMQGQSMLPLFKHSTYKSRDAIYYHYYENGEHQVSPHFGIKTTRYKLIRFYKRVESWELFDLKKDPHELQNIYATSQGRKLAVTLKKQLARLIDQYKDQEAKEILNTGI